MVVIGLDSGIACLKTAGDARPALERVTEPADVVARVRERGADRAAVAVSPARPERAEALRRALSAAGVDADRYPAPLCVAAGLAGGGPLRSVVVVDVGARDVTFALCEVDVGRVRALDDAVLPGVATEVTERLLDGTGRGGDRRAREALDSERGRSAARARLVLDRAEDDPSCLDTPVHPAGPLTPACTAGDLLAALAPLRRAVAEGLAAFLSRLPMTADLAQGEIVVTGGQALPPLVRTVRDACGDDGPVLRVAPPTAAAEGAATLGRGDVRVDRDHPHALAVEIHQVRGGYLETQVAPLTAAPDDPRRVVVHGTGGDVLPVRVRPHRAGPWRVARAAAAPLCPPEGRWVVTAGAGPGLGAVTLTREDGGDARTHLLARDAGPAVDGEEEP